MNPTDTSTASDDPGQPVVAVQDQPVYHEGRLFHPGFPDGSLVSRVQPRTWTQQDSVNYEVAQETTNQVLGAISAVRGREENKPQPDQQILDECHAACLALAQRDRALRPTDSAAVAAAIESNQQALTHWRNR